MEPRAKWTTNIKGRMTVFQFIVNNIDDSEDELRRIIKEGGFSYNGKNITDPNLVIDFKVGDVIRFDFGKTEFTVVDEGGELG